MSNRRTVRYGYKLMSEEHGPRTLVDNARRAGAYRVYEDPRDLLLHLDEIGVRTVTP